MALKLCSPWVNYYREIEALFGADKDVKIVFDEENYILKLFVTGVEKAEALARLLPAEREFGSVTVKTEVIPANPMGDSIQNVYKAAFKDNPALVNFETVETPFGTMNYAVFRNVVVQYPNDDIGDINGLRSTLYQDIAKDVFNNKDRVFFCTRRESWEF